MAFGATEIRRDTEKQRVGERVRVGGERLV